MRRFGHLSCIYTNPFLLSRAVLPSALQRISLSPSCMAQNPFTIRSPAFSASSAASKSQTALKLRSVPDGIPAPVYARTGRPMEVNELRIYNEKKLQGIRKANVLASRMRKYAGSLVKEGITTDDIDAKVHEKIISLGCYPAPLNYMQFPKSICTSVNEVICHGIPNSQYILKRGDIVKIDISVYVGGFFGDCCGTFVVGGEETLSDRHRVLVEGTRESLREALAICRAGQRLSAIGHTIHDVADKYGLGVVRNYWGHGIGEAMHQPPFIFHFRNNDEGIMLPGMTFTIEPMITEGHYENRVLSDGWTVVTTDGSYAAQFEETILISPTTGLPEVLTTDDESVWQTFFPEAKP